jgi:hypothetical protein
MVSSYGLRLAPNVPPRYTGDCPKATTLCSDEVLGVLLSVPAIYIYLFYQLVSAIYQLVFTVYQLVPARCLGSLMVVQFLWLFMIV